MSNPPKVVLQPALQAELCAYDRSLPAKDQSPSIPKTIRDAMAVRERVFVNELGAVPLIHHTDTDDARSAHWVLYSEFSDPIGTIRLVPSPHDPHPTSTTTAPSTINWTGWPMQSSEEVFLASLPKWTPESATSLHDGKEPYVKLGRLAVVKEARGGRKADLMIQAALKWASENGNFCAGQDKVGGEWKGLVCAHAMDKAVSTWERNGFVRDEAMGCWFEAGKKHFGMFCRIDVKKA